MECVICKEKITADPFGWEGGCNAEPVESGQCCHPCDINIVLPSRLAQYGKGVSVKWEYLTKKGAE